MGGLALRRGNISRHQEEIGARQPRGLRRHFRGVIMRHLAVYTALLLAIVGALPAEAQTRTLRRSREDVLILNVRPRSYLDAGNVVPVGSINFVTSGLARRPRSFCRRLTQTP